METYDAIIIGTGQAHRWRDAWRCRGMQVAVLERGLVAIETAAWRRPGMIILLLRS